MRSEPEEGDPFSFEGPEIIKCHGYVCFVCRCVEINYTISNIKFLCPA
jgi:hypothetical protein